MPFRQLFARPVFPDDETKTRSAGLLNLIVLTVLAIAAIANLALPFVPVPLALLGISGVVILLGLGELYLMHQGRVQLASMLFVSGHWIVYSILILISGGLGSVFPGGYFTTTVFAGLLLGRFAALTVAGLSILAGLGVLFIDGIGLLPGPLLSTDPWSEWMTFTANLTAAAVTLYLSTRSLDDALERAYRIEHAQTTANRELETIRQSLEAQITARTEDLVTRGAELEAANQQLEATARRSKRRADVLRASAEVSRSLAGIRDLDHLLPEITRLISQHFEYYHVGVFLLDEAGRHAVLQAANSEGGQRMLARQHRLSVGAEGIVDYVTGTGQPRIALDVGADAVFFDNPDLPDTRSELALPLRIRDDIIGALDVQSTRSEAFDQEDVALLTILADQIAIAIDNARLFRQSQAALKEVEVTYRRYLREEWDRHLSGRPIRRTPAGS